MKNRVIHRKILYSNHSILEYDRLISQSAIREDNFTFYLCNKEYPVRVSLVDVDRRFGEFDEESAFYWSMNAVEKLEMQFAPLIFPETIKKNLVYDIKKALLEKGARCRE